MRHAALAMVLVLAVGCASNKEDSWIDTGMVFEPCFTLRCARNRVFKDCIHAFNRARMDRGFVIIYPHDDPQYQLEVCRKRANTIKVI